MSEKCLALTEAAERLSLIRDHELGQVLLERPRYGHFRPPEMPIAEWLNLFDADVNNFEHNALTAELAYIVCTIDKSSPELIDKMILTASIHDLPEDVTGTIAGDKQYNLSSAEDEKREHERLFELSADPEFPLTVEEVELATLIMHDSKKKPPETHEGWTFNLIERVGYLRTAFMAWDALQNKAISPSHQVNIIWMIGNILGNHLSYLTSVRAKSPAVDILLNDTRPLLDDMVKVLSIRDVRNNIRDLCEISGEVSSKLNPDKEIERIARVCDDWSRAA